MEPVVGSGLRGRMELLGLVLLGLTTGCDIVNPLVLQDSEEMQAEYEAQATAWTRWALEQSWSEGPILDTNGSHCADNQSGDTWFLAGTSGGTVRRSCTIPADTQLFFPLINYWVFPTPDSIIEGDPENDLAAWQAFVEGYFPGRRHYTCGLTLRVDGQNLLPDLETMDEELWVDVLDPFDVVLGEDNFSTPFGGPSGPRVGWTAGHWALLTPLPPGVHKLELGGKRCNLDHTTAFSTRAVYVLHVEP